MGPRVNLLWSESSMVLVTHPGTISTLDDWTGSGAFKVIELDIEFQDSGYLTDVGTYSLFIDDDNLLNHIVSEMTYLQQK